MTPTQKKVMLSAIQATHSPTLGNYLGAIKNWVSTQADFDNLFFVVDLHSITSRQDPKAFRENTYLGVATLLAAGLDPNQCTLFIQSHVPEHAELNWILTCFSTMGELTRMTQFKDKSAKHGQSIPTGLFCYPVLMAADILLYNTDLVPVGEDQKQHVELTRDIAQRMNGIYGDDLFRLPEPMIPKLAAKIMSLQDPLKKMSKSDETPNATIFLTDSNDVIVKKLKRAVTDSGTEITFSDDKPGIKNLLTIQSSITGKSIDQLVASYVGKQYGHLKLETADIVVQAVTPIREEANRLLEDRAHLDRVFKQGAEKARLRAGKTLARVYDRLGFIPK